MPKVSIIIACYNDPHVVTAVEKARYQTYPHKEIILVDDGSDGDTKQLIESLIGEEITLISQDNRGQSCARNTGIRASTGDLIINWDSDDYFEPDFCEKAVRIMEEDEKVKIVTCKANRFTENGILDVFTPKGGTIDDFLFFNAALGSSMYRKRDWEAVGGYEEDLPILGMEDWEFYINILRSGGHAAVIDEVLFNYRLREGSVTRKIQPLKHEKFKYIILKHKDVYIAEFENTISTLAERLTQLEKEKLKIAGNIDTKVGKTLLKPFRFLKTIFS